MISVQPFLVGKAEESEQSGSFFSQVGAIMGTIRLQLWLLAVIDRHRAAEQVDDAHVREFQSAHFFRHRQLRRIMFQRFQNVGIGRRVAAEDQADERHGTFQVEEIKRAPHGVGRLAKIQHDEPRARPGNAVHFVHAPLPARQIPQAVAHGDDVEGVVGKRYLLCVALNELRVFIPAGDFGVGTSGFGNRQHVLAEIKPRGFRATPGKGEGEVTSPAAQVQGAVAAGDLRELDDLPLPKPVKTEALQVVDQVVTPRNRGEEVVDLRRALFAGVIESVAHAVSLAQRREEKSKPQKLCFFCRAAFVKFQHRPYSTNMRLV